MASMIEYVMLGIRGWLVTCADGSKVFFAYRDKDKAKALVAEENAK